MSDMADVAWSAPGKDSAPQDLTGQRPRQLDTRDNKESWDEPVQLMEIPLDSCGSSAVLVFECTMAVAAESAGSSTLDNQTSTKLIQREDALASLA